MIAGLFACISLALIAGGILTTGRGVATAVDAETNLILLRERGPSLLDNMVADAERAEAAGRLSSAQVAILRQRAQRHRELFTSLITEITEKQQELRDQVAVDAGMRTLMAAAGGAMQTQTVLTNVTVAQELGLRAVITANHAVAGMAVRAARPAVEIDDVRDTLTRLEQAWALPEDEFVLATLAARIRPQLLAAGVDRWDELPPSARQAVKQDALARLMQLRQQLRDEGWIPPGGDWDQFLKDEIKAFRRDSQATPEQHAAEAIEQYRAAGATTRKFYGWYDPDWRAEWASSHPGDQFLIFNLQMELTADNRCRFTGGGYYRYPAPATGVWRLVRVSIGLQPEKVTSAIITGTSTIGCDGGADDEGMSRDGSYTGAGTFTATPRPGGGWLLTVQPKQSPLQETMMPIRYVLLPNPDDDFEGIMRRSGLWRQGFDPMMKTF